MTDQTAPVVDAAPASNILAPHPALELVDFHVSFPTPDGPVQAVRGVDITVGKGEMVGVVGESGSGKSVTFLGVMGLLPQSAKITGSAKVDGIELVGARKSVTRSVRGQKIAMIFQDPLSALNPVHKIGKQIEEMLHAHQHLSGSAAATRAVELLDLVGIPQPAQRAKQFPHEFSGGMRQRVMIAMAIANDPEVLIADEPTTALDVTVQAQILEVIQRIQRELHTAVVLITHDLGVVAEHCDHIQVMYAGTLVETGRTRDIYFRAHHPYTWGLLQSIPRLDADVQQLRPIRGLPPSLIFVPPGCPFHPRCPYVMDVCRHTVPALLPSDGHHASACHLALSEKERIFRDEVLQQT